MPGLPSLAPVALDQRLLCVGTCSTYVNGHAWYGVDTTARRITFNPVSGCSLGSYVQAPTTFNVSFSDLNPSGMICQWAAAGDSRVVTGQTLTYDIASNSGDGPSRFIAAPTIGGQHDHWFQTYYRDAAAPAAPTLSASNARAAHGQRPAGQLHRERQRHFRDRRLQLLHRQRSDSGALTPSSPFAISVADGQHVVYIRPGTALQRQSLGGYSSFNAWIDTTAPNAVASAPDAAIRLTA